MADRLRELLRRIQEWWGKFSARQKAIIVTAAVMAVIGIAVLVAVLTRDTYVIIHLSDSAAEASNVKSLFDENNITYKMSDNGLTFSVLEEQQAEASLLLGANDIQAETYSIDNVTNSSLSTTESDKQKKYILYLENRLENDFIERFDAIKSANVELSIPEDNGTLISNDLESYASILLTIKEGEKFSPDNAAFLARAVATAIGNDTTDNIVIMDSKGEMLFSGADESTTAGIASSKLSAKTNAENRVRQDVQRVLLATNNYDTVEVAPNLNLIFSSTETTNHNYSAPEGMTQGLYAHSDQYASTNTTGVGGIPGTDSNTENDTSYVMESNGQSTSTVTEDQYDYLPNEEIIKTVDDGGRIDYDSSSVTVSAIKYNVVHEDDADVQAQLTGGLTWAQYKANQPERESLPVSDEMIDAVAKATGIAASNIRFQAWTENVFYDSEGGALSPTDIIQIILIVVILGLLAFVVLRSMRGEKQEEEEEEISVENLLESTPEESLEAIEAEEESETRKRIGEFVDNNPELAAGLLRTWLTEDGW